MKKALLLFCAVALVRVAAAQTIPVNPKFGAVSDEEVDMTVYAPDTSAVAVVLYRNYTLDLVFNFKLEIVQEVTVHERIKVLKEAGKDYADYSFIYRNSNSLKEYYSGLKVETYNREGGKVVRTKMSRKYQFDEVFSENMRRLSFSAENVKVGSVIEVSYKFTTPQFWSIDTINMQEEIPINEMKVDVGYAEYFIMNRTQRGYIRTDYRKDSSLETLPVDAATALSYTMNRDVFTAVDVPAMPPESYSFCPEQYRTQVLYDLSGVSIPGAVYKSYNTTWKDVDKVIAESDILPCCKTRIKDLDALQADLKDRENDEQRIVAVRNYVVDLVKWDKKSRLVPEAPRDVFKKGSGSDVDINALTASILNNIGFTAEPVMVKRRSSGILMNFHITMNAFDTFILRVTSPDGSQSWFLDAARDEGYLNVLHPQFLVTQARLIHLDGTGEWVDLSQLTKSQVGEIVKASLSADGTLAGTATIQARGEESFGIKANYNGFDSEDAFLEDLESDEQLEVISFDYAKEYSPATTMTYTFEREGTGGDLLYVHPFLSRFHSNTAFRKEERKIPVDFPYPSSITYSFNLSIPEGYSVEELPENKTLTCPPVGGRILFQCREVGSQITLTYRFIMERMQVMPDDYADLRAFWETAAGIEGCTIVLKKQ